MKKIISAILSIALFAFVAVSCEEPVTPSGPETPTPAEGPLLDPLVIESDFDIQVSPEEIFVGDEVTLSVPNPDKKHLTSFGCQIGNLKGETGRLESVRLDPLFGYEVFKAISAGKIHVKIIANGAKSKELTIEIKEVPAPASDAK